MREFYDHYLKGKPAPKWIKERILRPKMKEHLKKRSKKWKKVKNPKEE